MKMPLKCRPEQTRKKRQRKDIPIKISAKAGRENEDKADKRKKNKREDVFLLDAFTCVPRIYLL